MGSFKRNNLAIIIAIIVAASSILVVVDAFADAFAPPVPSDLTNLGTITVPHVGCGTIAWSADKVTGRPNPELVELVSTASGGSGGFFDTGERYGSHAKTALGMGWGETECLIAKLLHEERIQSQSTTSASAVVATKFTPSPWRTTAQSVVDACLESRKRLNVDAIDLYQIQMPDIVKPLRFLGYDKSNDEAYWDGLAECYHRGLVKNVGVSNYGPTLIAQCHDHLRRKGVPLVSNQIAYSLIGRHNGAQQTLDRCNELGVKVLAYYPFAMGLLTGKYTSDSPQMSVEDELMKRTVSSLSESSLSTSSTASSSSSSSSLSSSRRSNFERKDLERYARGDGVSVPKGGVAPLLRTMEKMAAERGVTVAQIALNYIICKGAIPIPGARTAAQYTDNNGALGWRLSPQEVDVLETEADSLGISFDGAGFKRSNAKFVGYGMETWSLT
jgi:pyridoxine 4-dehydrogenase